VISRKKSSLFLESRRHALERISAGDPLGEVLDELICTVDNTAHGRAEAALRYQLGRLESFNQLSRSISTDLDLEHIVQTVTDIATELSGAKFGAFFYNVVEDKGEQYLLYTLSGAPREAFARFGLPRNTPLFAPTFSGTGIVRSDDICADPRFGKLAPHYGMPKGHLPVVSYLAVPVISRSGTVHGGLFFGHDKPAVFTKVAEEIVKGVAIHAANAIDNAQVIQAARTEAAKRRRAVERHQKRTEALLKTSEARLQEALAAGQVMAFEWNALADLSHRSQNAAQILGFDHGNEPRSLKEYLAAVHPEDRAVLETVIAALNPHSPAYSINFRFIRPDGREVWLEEMARGEFDASGQCVRLKGLTRDITERKKAEQVAQRLVAIVESSDDAIVSEDLSGVIVSWNRGAERIFGYSAEEVIGKPLLSLFPADRQHEELTILQRIRRGERLRHYETVRRRKDGSLVDVSLTISPLRNVAGVIVGASKIARDISTRKRAEEHQRALNAELDHRVKNVLATVCAIIDRTRAGSTTYGDFVVGLDRRIRSMANTHDLLSRAHWHGVALAEIVEREFTPYGRGNSDVRGPSITLKAEAAQVVAMVLHELTTNAAKFGAFSKRGGRVRLNWWCQQNGERPRLAIEWTEVGGPPVAEPSQSGYGTSVVRELIPFELDGTVNLTFAKDGLRCRLEIPGDWISRGVSGDENGANASFFPAGP
jgi:PAS domain S-box-containing protein